MRLLVLGGTRFLGRAIVDDAISRGYDVTTFSRGLSGHPRPGAEMLHGDRTSAEDLRQLAGRDWDAVIDTSTIAPVHVAASARLLAGHVGHYTYVSTISVYRDRVSTISVYRDRPGEMITEESPVVDCSPDASGTAETLDYPELKAGSERAVQEAMPGRNLITRPGLIIGPHEDVGRLPWWLTRVARGGPVLAPPVDTELRMTDARDLAAWLTDNTRRRIPGVVNVPGPQGTTFGDLLAACAQVTAPQRGDGLELRPTADPVLLGAGLEPWMELPMWAPDTPEFAGIWQVSGDRALRTRMRYRPLMDTVRDTWHWLTREAASQDRPVSAFARRPGIGLDPAREQEILATL
jgi:2'-hydroxyisoflavone reductase